MTNAELTGSIKALLDEYKKAIDELICIIKPLNDSRLSMVVDNETKDSDCKSIQTVLTHVVCSGYNYTIYIENSIGVNKPRVERVICNSVDKYIDQLNLMFGYCEDFFRQKRNLQIQQTDNSKKVIVNWGQQYDIEQLLEHAIVHILRHRRQIESFIKIQNEQATRGKSVS
jgi:uncharacterized damage-inducible protein DinB